MIKKNFLQAFGVSLMASFQLCATNLATNLENFEDLSNPRFSDACVHIASKLEEEKDVVQLSRVCKLTHEATANPGSWEGVAPKYQIQPKQVRRYLEILSQYKGQEEIKLGPCWAIYAFHYLERSYVEKFIYTKAEVAPYAVPSPNSLWLNESTNITKHIFNEEYIKVNDYVRLKVEEEEKLESSVKEMIGELPYFTFAPIGIASDYIAADSDQFFIKSDELPQDK